MSETLTISEGFCCNQAQTILITGGCIIIGVVISAIVYYKYKLRNR